MSFRLSVAGDLLFLPTSTHGTVLFSWHIYYSKHMSLWHAIIHIFVVLYVRYIGEYQTITQKIWFNNQYLHPILECLLFQIPLSFIRVQNSHNISAVIYNLNKTTEC